MTEMPFCSFLYLWVLRRGVFFGLPSITLIILHSNQLVSMESGVFEGISRLQVDLRWNPIVCSEEKLHKWLNRQDSVKFTGSVSKYAWLHLKFLNVCGFLAKPLLN